MLVSDTYSIWAGAKFIKMRRRIDAIEFWRQNILEELVDAFFPHYFSSKLLQGQHEKLICGCKNGGKNKFLMLV